MDYCNIGWVPQLMDRYAGRFTQGLLMAFQEPLEQSNDVLKQVEAVSNLDGAGSATTCPIRVVGRSISTDDLYPRMLCEPVLQEIGRAHV